MTTPSLTNPGDPSDRSEFFEAVHEAAMWHGEPIGALLLMAARTPFLWSARTRERIVEGLRATGHDTFADEIEFPDSPV